MFVDELSELARMTGPHPLLSPWSPKPIPGLVNRKLGHHPFTPHQLRHSCATNLVKAGVPIHIVKQVMNHRDIQTTMGYVKVASSDLSDWLEQSNGSPSTAVTGLQ